VPQLLGEALDAAFKIVHEDARQSFGRQAGEDRSALREGVSSRHDFDAAPTDLAQPRETGNRAWSRFRVDA
jgi:hypothetical protein